MENYGWSIELNPGYVLIIGNAHDAHIQLDSAYGRAVRVGLQVKDDISCAMLSEYSSSYNTLVNGKSIQRIATVKNHDFIHFLRREMLDFTAFPVFFVSNLLLVQRKKYYFNRATVSRNCSIVL